MSLAPHLRQGGWTLADLDDLPDDGLRYELVDGGLVVTPPPTQQHQDRSAALCELLRASAPPGWRCRVEWPLPLAEDTQRLADLAAYRWPPRRPRADPRSPVGPDDVGLVGEVVSPGSRRTDRYAKPGDYAEAGIPVFWRLETEPELVLLAFRLDQGRYVEVSRVRDRGTAPTPWGDVVVDVAALDEP